MKPGPLLSRPRLKRQDAPYLDAYYCLSAARTAGFGGADPIQVSEIVAYLNLVGVSGAEERARYLRTIQQLDHTYLTYARERAEEVNR